MFAIVSYRWDFLWANQSFHTAQKRQSEKEMAKHRKQFVPLSCKASSGLYYIFFPHPPSRIYLFLFSRSLVRKFRVWAMVIYETIIHIRLWMEKYIHRRAGIQFSIHTLPRCPFSVHVLPYTTHCTFYRHRSHSLAGLLCLCDGLHLCFYSFRSMREFIRLFRLLCDVYTHFACHTNQRNRI